MKPKSAGDGNLLSFSIFNDYHHHHQHQHHQSVPLKSLANMPKPNVQSIESAREQIIDMLEAMGEDSSPGFSKACIDQESARLLVAERSEDLKKSRVVVEMKVTEKMTNQLSNLHGGAQTTLMDCFTSLVIYLHTSGVFGEPWAMLGVSQSMQIIFTAPIPVNTYIDIECTSLAIGKSVAAIQCEIWTKDGKDGKRLVRGSSGTHTKIDNSTQAKL